MGEDKADNPPIGSGAWIGAMKKKEEELSAKKAKRRPKIDEHLSLDQTDREQGQRAKGHPTYGRTREIPDRWSSTGQKPKLPGR